jgi:DNA-binding NarL/FixJ family response regulator
MDPIRVVVADEHEVFRRGVLACLRDDPAIRVVEEAEEHDVLIACDLHLMSRSSDRPTVVCAADDASPATLQADPSIYAVLPRRSVTAQQIISAVRAAAVGLRVNTVEADPPALDDRSVEVLRLLASGADTREISWTLGYSERTIKGVIYGAERELGAKNRAHAVAEAVRQRLI